MKSVSIEELYNINPDIDMGDCLLKYENPNNPGEGSLKISIIRDINNTNYIYSAEIICSKDFKNMERKIATFEDEGNKNIYYDSGIQ